MNDKVFLLKKRLLSFRYAYQGIMYLLKQEHNARIHVTAGVFTIILGMILKLQAWEWVAVVLMVTLVIIVETINTAIENLCDFISQDRSQEIKIIKDLGAAAVLISALMAGVTGLIIYTPKLIKLVL